MVASYILNSCFDYVCKSDTLTVAIKYTTYHSILEGCPKLPTNVQWDYQYPIISLGDVDKLFSSHIPLLIIPTPIVPLG